MEQALVLTNPDSSFCQNERELQYTQGHIVSGDLSGNVVAVCGIVLPRLQLLSEEQVCNLFFFFLVRIPKCSELTLLPASMILRYYMCIFELSPRVL